MSVMVMFAGKNVTGKLTWLTPVYVRREVKPVTTTVKVRSLSHSTLSIVTELLNGTVVYPPVCRNVIVSA